MKKSFISTNNEMLSNRLLAHFSVSTLYPAQSAGALKLCSSITSKIVLDGPSSGTIFLISSNCCLHNGQFPPK